MMDEFIISDLIEEVDSYKQAKKADDNNPDSEFGIGTWKALDDARSELRKAFKAAVLDAMGIKEIS